MTTLAAHKARVEAARRTLAEGRAALHDKDGRRLYADHEHARRERELAATFRRTIAEAVEAAQAVVAEVDADLERPDADPVHRLTAAELERAVLLKQLLGERLLTAPLRDVDDEVQALLRDGDRPARYVAWRVVTDRRQALVAAGVARATDLAGRLRAERGGEAGPLATMAERLLATLVDVDARRAAQEAARERRSEAIGIITAAGLTQYLTSEYDRSPGTTVTVGAA